VTTESSEGDVYSLAVPPHHFYVSGGAVVHNSVKGAQWKNCYVSMPKGKFPFEPPVKPGAPPPPPEQTEEEMASERRLGYVALTRAAKNLTVICPASVGGKAAGVSPFVAESGLQVGENVPKPGAETADDEVDETIKTAASVISESQYDYEGVIPDAYEDITPEEWEREEEPEPDQPLDVTSSYDRRQS
jgi:ATP-dependent exoDNAse (exonuclease V) beta subunit